MKKSKFILTILLLVFSISMNAQNRVNDTIVNYKYDTLSAERLDATYKFIDSVIQENNVNFDNINNILISITSNDISFGIFNLDLKEIINYNIGNGFKLGLGFKTNEKMSKFVSVDAFGNYWFKAKEFNYGGNLDFNILPSKKMKLSISAVRQFERFGNYGFQDKTSVLNTLNYKQFFINATSLNTMISAEYSTYINRHLKGFVRFEVGDKNVFNNSQFFSFSGSQFFRLSTLDFRLRIAFGERFIRSKNGLSVEGRGNPVIWLSYQKNLKGVFGSPYDFYKYEFLFRGRKVTKYLGETSLTAQIGYVHGAAPATELFNIEASGLGKFNIYCTESFNTMRPDEFLCDRFAALFFSHNFKNLLFDFKRFHPEIIVVTNVAWGDLKTQRLSDAATQRLGDLKKGYYESGIILDNIIRVAFIKYGMGVFYRYGPNSYDKTWDNFVFKISLGFGL